MTEALCNIKRFNKSKKRCFPSRSTFKPHSKKRKKPNQWINLHSSFDSSKSKNKTIDTFSIEDTFSEEIDSSIICNQEIENYLQLSPILKYSTFERKSPIIGNKFVIKESIKKDNEIQNTFSLDLEQCEIEFDEQSTIVSNIINEFLSQDCSRISPIKENIERVNEEQNLYYEVPRKRKKPFKKDGLANNLQMALLRRNTEVSFWKHEQETGKNTTVCDNLSTLLVQVKQCCKQFSVFVLECEDLNKAENCLIILGSDVTTYVCTNINSNIKIYQPYLEKQIKYKDNFIPCYFNVTKIINL